jgi:hypothetical protein
MAKVQKQFEQFHEAIKLRRYRENATLAEKRERVLRTLSDGIVRLRKEGVSVPTYRHFNQGSYDLGVGVKPLDGDYDIDVGVAFDLARQDHGPVDVKSWVFDAVQDHTDNVRIRQSCVTVFYHAEGEPVYHVDLAVYADAEKNGGQLFLARGTAGSAEENRGWTSSDPEGLTDLVNSKFSGDDRKQLRRVIRYLKRWKDLKFPKDGNAAPRGIAITIAAYHWFLPRCLWADGVQQRDDLDALRSLVAAMIASFSPRLAVQCPASPFDDLCARMSDAQMQSFKTRLEELLDVLRDAIEDTDPHTACKALASEFGNDFPIPDPEDSGKRQRRAITSSGSSA